MLFAVASRSQRFLGSTPTALRSDRVEAEGAPGPRSAAMCSFAAVFFLWVFRLAGSRSLSIGGAEPSRSALRIRHYVF